jgi:hypothetical protein
MKRDPLFWMLAALVGFAVMLITALTYGILFFR